ncbi:MAG: hypothetical protein K8T26_06415 [Lentisphaerae bacterium]|nr:hypothetical protein [Lentisphaerota bacterium]
MKAAPYDCDTRPYWCDDRLGTGRQNAYGHFVDEGGGYRITTPATPRPWLNYFANPRFGAVLAPDGGGFCWYKTPLMRITRYEHPIDYLPRQFVDGRDVLVTDLASSASAHPFRDGDARVCTHHPGHSVLTATVAGLHVHGTFFVPAALACEIWLVRVSNPGPRARRIRLEFAQTWSMARFGSHTAEAGIPYVSVPGQGMTTEVAGHAVAAAVSAPELPWHLHAVFASPGGVARVEPVPETRADGRRFVFHRCTVVQEVELEPGACRDFAVYAAATEDAAEAQRIRDASLEDARREYGELLASWQGLARRAHCTIPEKSAEYFLNYWLKNQLHLTFHFVRAGHWGYRDALQDAWGYAMLCPAEAADRLRFMLSGMFADGTAPRQLSKFEDGRHDLRRYMDSVVWAPRAVLGYLQETGDRGLLGETLPFLDRDRSTVLDHLRRGVDALWERRGAHGGCLTGDGDWNDALEGISRDGDAESYWLTMALYDALLTMQELYGFSGDPAAAGVMAQRADEIKRVVNASAWDGAWYRYGVTGRGQPIGSQENREGRIHLNAQSWAVLTGLADAERAALAIAAVDRHLESPVGPVLLAPPYVAEAKEIGRIARLEPGTFENGSVYQHAVTFYILALLRAGRHAEALDLFTRVLPTNPRNGDDRRTSEPYCTGNFYCGSGHPRFGQNFFTWFTGNAAWLLRIGFDELLGVRAGLEGLVIAPRVPAGWTEWRVEREYRGCCYELTFTRRADVQAMEIRVDGRRLEGAVIPPLTASRSVVDVRLPLAPPSEASQR